MKSVTVVASLILYILSAVFFFVGWVNGSVPEMLFWGVLLLLNQATLNHELRGEQG